jgi:CRP/FNR family nitrogen fixation transcriptional regulator
LKEIRLRKSVIKNGKVSRVSSAKAMGNAIDLMGVAKQFRRNDKLFSDGDKAKYIYKVESGCIKTYNILKGDRRHIRAFHLAGDYIGLEDNKHHDCIADAIAPSVVRPIDKKKLLARAYADIGMLKYLLAVTGEELMRVREHKALLLMTAESRVASFLLEVAGRDSRRGAIGMPLVRQELADHLGLTFETVSRILWRLERSKIISLPERHSAVIKNTTALKRMSA